MHFVCAVCMERNENSPRFVVWIEGFRSLLTLFITKLKIRGVMMSSLLNTISLVIIVITFETVKNDDGTQKQLFDIVAWKQHDSWEAMQQIDLNLTTVSYTTDTKRANAKSANLRDSQGRAHLITLKHKHYGCNHWVERPTEFSVSRGDFEYRQNSDSRHLESQQPRTKTAQKQTFHVTFFATEWLWMVL